jgi:RNA polymerase sigma-70 factor (ECF subfamily)
LPGWARSLVDTADLIQDALTRTLPHLRRFEPRREKALQAYLRTAVSNEIRNELRRIRRTPEFSEVVGEETEIATNDQPQDESLIDREEQQRYAKALTRLTETDRSAIVARLQLGYSYEQIALILEKRSANAARMTVSRAIARLIESMTEESGINA